MLLPLLFNLSLMVSLSAVYEYLIRRWSLPERPERWAWSGLLFGLGGMMCVAFPVEMAPGILLDGRTVVLTLAGYFIPPAGALLATALTGSYRLSLGGDGAVVGVLMGTSAMLLGMGCRQLVRQGRLQASPVCFLGLGLTVHLVDLVLFVLFLSQTHSSLIVTYAIKVIAILSPATALNALLLQTLEDQRHLERELAHSNALRHAITRASPDVLMVLDEDGRYLEVVSPNEHLLYTHADKLLGNTIHGVMTQEDADKYLAFIRQAIRQNTPQRIEYDLTTLGGPHVFEGTAQTLNFRVNGKETVLFVAHDITARVQAEAERRVAAIAFEAQQGMVIADVHAIILKVNTTFCETLGYLPEELIGQPTRILRSGHQDAAYYRAMWQSMTEHGQWEGEIWDRHKNGTLIPMWMTLKAVKTPQGQVTHYVAATTDISERKAMEREIQALAFYDQLTGLPNRRLFLDRLRQALSRAHRNLHVAAVLYLDLDGFKQVNDVLGHHAGDLLLAQVGQRLHGVVRESDTVARLGGDEFVLLQELATPCPETARAHAQQVAQKILESLSTPFDLEGHPAQIGASLGAALLTPDMQDTDTVLGRADAAMYQAKTQGKGQICFFADGQGKAAAGDSAPAQTKNS